MRILGLDPSLTNFGWAIHETAAAGEARCPERGRFQTSARMLYVSRYMDLRANLRSLIRDTRPDRVGLEFPVFGNIYSEGMYGLFLFCSEALYEESQDVVFWSPLQVKAHARERLGRPKKWTMHKLDMVDAARADTGGGRWNHNEADAYLAAVLSGRFWLFFDGALALEELSSVERKYFAEIKRYIKGKRAGQEVRSGVMYREDERFFRWSEGDDGQEAEVGSGEGGGDAGRLAPEEVGDE